MRSKVAHSIIGITTVFIALVVINFLASRHHARIDLTERSVYTLSSSTKDILKGLDDVVTVRVYFSFDLPPALMPLKRGVDDIIEEFKNVAGNKLQVEYVEPAANVLDEQRTLSLGIIPVQVNLIGRDRSEVAKVFMGLTVLHGDRMEVIPVVQSLSNLEYNLVQAVLKASSDQELKIGWLGDQSTVGDGAEKDVGGGYDGLKGVLEQRYEIVPISSKNLDDLAVNKLNALMLVSPGVLANDVIAAVDEYIGKGGKVIALVDRWNIGGDMKGEPKETNVVDFFNKHGVKIGSGLVMDRSNATAAFAGALVTYHLPYPFWPLVRSDDLSKDDPITSELNSLVLPWTSPITLSGAVSDQAEVLARTTEAAAVTKQKNPGLDPESAGEWLEKASDAESYPLVVRIGDLMVVGSSRFAQDYFLRLFSNNLTFIENAVDVFVMGDQLVDIRSRVGIDRPLAIMSDAVMFVLRIGNVLICPILVILIGLCVFIVRKWNRRRIRAEFGR